MDTTNKDEKSTITVSEAIDTTQMKIIAAIEESNLDVSIIKLILKDIFNQVVAIENGMGG